MNYKIFIFLYFLSAFNLFAMEHQGLQNSFNRFTWHGTSNEQGYLCPCRGKELAVYIKQVTTLLKHIKEKHQNRDQTFSCTEPECLHTSFKTVNDVFIHLRDDHTLFKTCCGSLLKNDEEYFEHSTRYHGFNKSFELLNTKKRKRSGTRNKDSITPKNSFVCPCGSHLQDSFFSSLEEHSYLKHYNTILKGYPCIISDCNKFLATGADFIHHLSEEHIAFNINGDYVANIVDFDKIIAVPLEKKQKSSSLPSSNLEKETPTIPLTISLLDAREDRQTEAMKTPETTANRLPEDFSVTDDSTAALYNFISPCLCGKSSAITENALLIHISKYHPDLVCPAPGCNVIALQRKILFNHFESAHKKFKTCCGHLLNKDTYFLHSYTYHIDKHNDINESTVTKVLDILTAEKQKIARTSNNTCKNFLKNYKQIIIYYKKLLNSNSYIWWHDIIINELIDAYSNIINYLLSKNENNIAVEFYKNIHKKCVRQGYDQYPNIQKKLRLLIIPQPVARQTRVVLSIQDTSDKDKNNVNDHTIEHDDTHQKEQEELILKDILNDIAIDDDSYDIAANNQEDNNLPTENDAILSEDNDCLNTVLDQRLEDALLNIDEYLTSLPSPGEKETLSHSTPTHLVLTENIPGISTPKRNPNFCPCQKTKATTVRSFIDHIYSHHYNQEIQKFVCPEQDCQATFDQSQELLLHLESKKQFNICHKCKRLYTYDDFINHIYISHPNAYLFNQ